YSILGVLFVLRGALQGLGQTAVPMVTGVIELVMRLGTAIVLGAVFGYAGVVWGTPLAWAGAVALLIPAYVRAHRRLAALPDGPAVTGPTPVIDGPPADDELLGTVHDPDLDAVRTDHEPAPSATTGPEQEPAPRQLVSTGTGSFPSLDD